jgi:SAM-dependent methyltransferase
MDERSAGGIDPYAHYAEWKRWDGAASPDANDARYYAAEFDGIALSGRRVLEIGFGNGRFLAWARDVGARIVGVEINAPMRDAARSAGFDVVDDAPEALAARGEKFDVVVAFDVLEHFDADELSSLFRAVHSMLVDGGVFVSRFPNGQSPFGRAYQHGDFSHKSTLTTYKIEYLAGITGFDIVRIANPCRVARRGALGSLRHWWLARRRRRFERTIARLYDMRRLPLDPNLVAVLRKSGAAKSTSTRTST